MSSTISPPPKLTVSPPRSGSSFASRWRVSTRLGALVLLPLLAFVAVTAMQILTARHTSSAMSQVAAIGNLTGAIGDLVTDLSREAGASAEFIASKGSSMRERLSGLREATSRGVQKLTDEITRSGLDARADGPGQALKAAKAELDLLSTKRSLVDGLSTPVSEINDYFTPTIGRLLNVSLEMLKVVDEPQVAVRASAYVYMMWLKEASAATRANGPVGFARGSFEPAEVKRLQAFVTWQSVYRKLFDVYATEDQKAFFAKTLSGPAVQEAESMTMLAINTVPGASVASVTAAQWSAATTARIDLMTQIEQRLRADFQRSADDVASSSFAKMQALFIVGSLLVTMIIVFTFFVLSGLTKPISAISNAMSRVAAGENQIEVPNIGDRDEIGDLARALEIFKTNGLEAARMREEQKELETFTAAQRKRDMIKLADDFEGAVGEIINTVSSASTELEASATSLTTVAERSQKVAVVVAAASEEASMNVQSVASATEEMAATVNEISRQVQESSRVANDAVEQAQITNDRVGELSEAATRIGVVVELITSIAAQTNLLALNATIEAARAGEAGRGFAVVASEVKALAEQTTKATAEIGQQITSIQKATGLSVVAIKEIGTTIGKMSEIASTIAAAVEEQGAATQEISRNVQQAAQGTMEVTSNIVDVQRGTSETGSASSQVLSAAQSLSQDSNRLKLEVGRFLTTVRAA